MSTSAGQPNTGKAQKPCDVPCPKCGSMDICRTWRPKGCQFAYDSADHAPGEDRDIAYAQYGVAMATQECIQHHCRTCHFEWNTPPLPEVPT